MAETGHDALNWSLRDEGKTIPQIREILQEDIHGSNR